MAMDHRAGLRSRWSRKRLVIDSLAPLARSRSLEILTLSDVVPADGRLAVLAGSPVFEVSMRPTGSRLSNSWCQGCAPRSVLDDPCVTTSAGTTCSRCGQKDVMLSGGRPIVCPGCSADRIRDQVAEWNTLLSRARS
jgi:hypothetical protein